MSQRTAEFLLDAKVEYAAAVIVRVKSPTLLGCTFERSFAIGR